MNSPANNLRLREAVLQTYQGVIAQGLGIGASGNVSARVDDGMLITPSGITPENLSAKQMVATDFDGAAEGAYKPSSEWQMHARIYQTQPQAQAVVHCHSRYATVLACARKAIPAVNYMIAVANAREIPCAEYASFGTPALADAMAAAMGDRKACLLANHGQIAWGESLAEALRVAAEVEELAATYWSCLALGEVTLLSDEEMAEVELSFKDYGPDR